MVVTQIKHAPPDSSLWAWSCSIKQVDKPGKLNPLPPTWPVRRWPDFFLGGGFLKNGFWCGFPSLVRSQILLRFPKGGKWEYSVYIFHRDWDLESRIRRRSFGPHHNSPFDWHRLQAFLGFYPWCVAVHFRVCCCILFRWVLIFKWLLLIFTAPPPNIWSWRTKMGQYKWGSGNLIYNIMIINNPPSCSHFLEPFLWSFAPPLFVPIRCVSSLPPGGRACFFSDTEVRFGQGDGEHINQQIMLNIWAHIFAIQLWLTLHTNQSTYNTLLETLRDYDRGSRKPKR